MWKGESIGKHVGTLAKLIKINPMDFVHGRGNGKEEVGRRPTTRWGPKAPDPMSWHITHQTGHNLGGWGRAPIASPHPGQLLLFAYPCVYLAR